MAAPPSRTKTEESVRPMEALDEFARDSGLTEADAVAIGRAWRRDIHEHVSGR